MFSFLKKFVWYVYILESIYFFLFFVQLIFRLICSFLDVIKIGMLKINLFQTNFAWSIFFPFIQRCNLTVKNIRYC